MILTPTATAPFNRWWKNKLNPGEILWEHFTDEEFVVKSSIEGDSRSYEVAFVVEACQPGNDGFNAQKRKQAKKADADS